MAAISYEVRPSKDVVRKVFVDILRRLTPLSPLSNYQYIGFGALEFVDFDIIHRRLGIMKMTSIEQNTAAIERYRWNRPFNGIDVIGGRAADVLPTLDWTRLSIVWLDYTSTLTEEVIHDAERVARVLIPGSVLAITINCHPGRLNDRRDSLERAVGAANVPVGVTDNRLGDWGLARAQHEILTAAVGSALARRSDGAMWRQILDIHYQDNAKMQMVAGVIGAPALNRTIDQCQFPDASIQQGPGDDPIEIRVPLLTQRERSHLNTMLPSSPDELPPGLPGVEIKDVESYARVYRWLDSAAG